MFLVFQLDEQCFDSTKCDDYCCNTRVVRIMGADQHSLSTTPYPTGHTGRFAIQDGGNNNNGTSAAAADVSQTLAGPTGTAAFALTTIATGGQSR